MNGILEGSQLRGGWARLLVWGGALVLLLAPLVAMGLDAEGVHWTAMDFVFAAVMLGGACGMYELAVRLGRDNAYVLAAGLAVGAGFVTTWANLAVGILGSEDNPVNNWFFAVPAFALLAALAVGLRSRGLAWAMRLTAAVQLALAAWLAAAGHGQVWVFTGLVCAAWLASAAFFARAR